MKALLTLDKRMNKSLAFNETRRVENLTESERMQNAKPISHTKNITLMTWDRRRWNPLHCLSGLEKPHLHRRATYCEGE